MAIHMSVALIGVALYALRVALDFPIARLVSRDGVRIAIFFAAIGIIAVIGAALRVTGREDKATFSGGYLAAVHVGALPSGEQALFKVSLKNGDQFLATIPHHRAADLRALLRSVNASAQWTWEN